MTEDGYLGDGVYASFDGYHVVLDLRAQDSTTRIALEPQVIEALKMFCDDLTRQTRQVVGPGRFFERIGHDNEQVCNGTGDDDGDGVGHDATDGG